jgi:hypothetical protein
MLVHLLEHGLSVLFERGGVLLELLREMRRVFLEFLREMTELGLQMRQDVLKVRHDVLEMLLEVARNRRGSGGVALRERGRVVHANLQPKNGLGGELRTTDGFIDVGISVNSDEIVVLVTPEKGEGGRLLDLEQLGHNGSKLLDVEPVGNVDGAAAEVVAATKLALENES